MRTAASAAPPPAPSPAAPSAPSPMIPTCRAMTSAVRGWSPVIITGRIPAAMAVRTASRASARAGSIMAISPTSTRSFSQSSGASPARRPAPPCPGATPPSPAGSARKPTASTRIPREARLRFRSSTELRVASSRGSALSPSQNEVARGSRASGAPLVNEICPARRSARCAASASSPDTGPAGAAWAVVISLRSESKGISPVRGNVFSSSVLSRPRCTPAMTRAPSVGSPSARNWLAPAPSHDTLARARLKHRVIAEHPAGDQHGDRRLVPHQRGVVACGYAG